jgi:hypothetical protein
MTLFGTFVTDIGQILPVKAAKYSLSTNWHTFPCSAAIPGQNSIRIPRRTITDRPESGAGAQYPRVGLYHNALISMPVEAASVIVQTFAYLAGLDLGDRAQRNDRSNME